jgi:TonB family protein
MHTPFARLVLSLLLALLAHPAVAQDAGKVPGLDESKIPDWIKRQAASPQKTILNSTKPKAEPAKAEVVPVRVGRTVSRRLPPLAMEPTAAGPAVRTVSEPTAVDAAGPAATPATTAPPPTALPVAAPVAADVPGGAPPGLTQPVPDTAEPPPAPAAPAQAEPAALPNLELIERADPALTADLIDARLADASVTVSFTVGTQGEVIAPQIVASTDRRLNRPVLRAVAEWRYAPVSAPRPHTVKFSFAVTP